MYQYISALANARLPADSSTSLGPLYRPLGHVLMHADILHLGVLCFSCGQTLVYVVYMQRQSLSAISGSHARHGGRVSEAGVPSCTAVVGMLSCASHFLPGRAAPPLATFHASATVFARVRPLTPARRCACPSVASWQVQGGSGLRLCGGPQRELAQRIHERRRKKCALVVLAGVHIYLLFVVALVSCIGRAVYDKLRI